MGGGEDGARGMLRIEFRDEPGDPAAEVRKAFAALEVNGLRMISPLLDQARALAPEVSQKCARERAIVEVSQEMALADLHPMYPGNGHRGLSGSQGIARVNPVNGFAPKTVGERNRLRAAKLIKSTATLHAPFCVPGSTGVADEKKSEHGTGF